MNVNEVESASADEAASAQGAAPALYGGGMQGSASAATRRSGASCRQSHDGGVVAGRAV